MTKDTVILIPSYEPDNRLITLVDTLFSMGYPILLINDGSNEKFDEIFDQVKDKVKYLKHPSNKGKGIALKHGFSYLAFDNMNAKYVITCDGDGQHAIEDIVRVDNKLHQTNETVFGVREFGKDIPHRSKVGNNMSRLWRTMVTKDYLQDDQCGLRGFPFKYLDDLTAITGGRYEYEMNVVCNFQMKSLPIYEVIIKTIYLDDNKSSHFRPGPDTFRIQRAIFSHCIPGLLTYFFTIFFFVVLMLAHPDMEAFTAGVAFTTLFACGARIGLLSLLYPTKRMGKRVLNEGIFSYAHGTVLLGLFTFFDFVCNFHPHVNICLSLLLSVLVNFVLAYIIHSIKFIKIKGEK